MLWQIGKCDVSVKSAHLLYGSDDYLAYSDDSCIPHKVYQPNDYAAAASEMLTLNCGKSAETYIFEGCDHLLLNSDTTSYSLKTISSLSQLIRSVVQYA